MKAKNNQLSKNRLDIKFGPACVPDKSGTGSGKSCWLATGNSNYPSLTGGLLSDGRSA